MDVNLDHAAAQIAETLVSGGIMFELFKGVTLYDQDGGTAAACFI